MRKTYLFILLLLVSGVSAFTQGYTIKNYDVDIKLSQEGYFDVHEIITVNFLEKKRGIMRNIPKKIKINNNIQSLSLSQVKVIDKEFKLLNDGNDKVIRIGNEDTFLTGEHQYDFSYRISNGYIFEEDHTAFQYNVIHEWDTTIDRLSYNIELPTELDIRYNNYKIFTGEDDGNERDATIEKKGKNIYGKSLKVIPPHHNVTIAVKLPVNYIIRPAPPIPFYKKDKTWFAPLLLIYGLIAFYRNKTLTPKNGNIKEQYFPPENFTPAEVGTYYDNKVNTVDIISLLPYWADNDYIKITGAEDNDDLFFKKLAPLPERLPEFQHIIFNAIFQDEDLVLLSELKNKLYAHTHSASSSLKKHLHNKQLYDEPHTKLFHSGRMILLGLIAIIGGIFISVMSYPLTGVVLIVTGIVAIIIHFLPKKKSAKGIQIYHHLQGLRSFLDSGSGQKTEELLKNHPRYFEQMLPYAIALGLDASWLKKISAYQTDAPYWYAFGPHITNTKPDLGNFSKSFNVSEIKSVFTSQAHSTSSSGSGGGFSGGSAGGGVGGGGSSW